MKKIFPFFLLVLLLASCQKDPDMSKLDNDFLVFTNHDKDAKFESFTTFYIPDSVLVIGTSEKPQFWTANEADDIITTLVNNMESCKFLTYKVLNISLTTTMATTTRTGGGTIRDIGVRVTGDRVGVIGITRIL